MKKKNEKLVKIHEREIFNIIERSENKVTTFTITLANYKIKEFDTLANAELYLMERPWELMIQVIGIINEIYKKQQV